MKESHLKNHDLICISTFEILLDISWMTIVCPQIAQQIQMVEVQEYRSFPL